MRICRIATEFFGNYRPDRGRFKPPTFGYFYAVFRKNNSGRSGYDLSIVQSDNSYNGHINKKGFPPPKTKMPLSTPTAIASVFCVLADLARERAPSNVSLNPTGCSFCPDDVLTPVTEAFILNLSQAFRTASSLWELVEPNTTPIFSCIAPNCSPFLAIAFLASSDGCFPSGLTETPSTSVSTPQSGQQKVRKSSGLVSP